MFNQVLKKIENTINAGINNVKMIVNNLNENRPVFTIQDKKYYLRVNYMHFYIFYTYK